MQHKRGPDGHAPYCLDTGDRALGVFDPGFPPLLLSIPATRWCWNASPARPSGAAARLRLDVPPALSEIHAAEHPRAGGHILTGPVAVAGAEPGDMLAVHRPDRIGADWGYCGFRPLGGTLPEDFLEPFLTYIPVDRDRAPAGCRVAPS